jgi:hypothetical protein
MRNLTSRFAAVLATTLASFLTLAHGVAAQPAGGGGPRPEPTEEEIAVRARLGDTSVLMGSVQIPAAVNVCGTNPGYTRLVCLIDLLKESASDKILGNLQLEYSVAEAQNWSNLPAGAFPARPGVFLGEFSVEQRGMIKAILMEATGDADNEGFDEMVQTLNADDYIGSVSTDYGVGYASYNGIFALLGTPAETGTWQLYYGGHHFAFANTYTNGVLAGATPSFRGVEPFPRFYMNSRENMPLMQEREAFADILRSLSDEETATATLEGTYRDILAGPQADDAIPEAQEGISVSELSEDQQALILAAIETYVGDIDAADAARYMAKYTEELPDTVLGFTGTTELTQADDYIRIHGPSLWLEFSMQTNKSTGEAGNHPHSVWRDIFDDYGGNQE